MTSTRPAPVRASARFWVCLLVLGGMAVAWPLILKSLDYHTRKDAVPLKKSLRFFDWQGLSPRYKLHETQPPDLSEETIHSLNTREYFMCRLIDTTLRPEDPTSAMDLAITYYTGQPDLVPHVPTECMVAGGYDLLRDEPRVVVSVPGIGAAKDEVPVHMNVFAAPRSGDGMSESRDVSVVYFFHANGDYCTTNHEVRLKQMNLLERYAYFSKIEVKFSSANGAARASREQTIAALTPLLERLMPLLMREHFNWNELHAPAPDSSAGGVRTGNGTK